MSRCLPVVERELRAAARRKSTFRTRWLAAAATTALGMWIWGWLRNDLLPHERGVFLFRSVAGVALLYALRAGIAATADCLSREKREGTLGFLFLSNLKGYDVLLGKLAAASLDSVYRLLAVFPVLAIPILLGALSVGEFLRTLLVLGNTLFLSLSAGMLASALSTRGSRAMAGTALLLVFAAAGLPLVVWFAGFGNSAGAFKMVWLWGSAVSPAVLMSDARYVIYAREFWFASALAHGLGWLFLIVANVVVRRTWRAAPATSRNSGWLGRWRAVKFGREAERGVFRSELLDDNPVLWLAARDRTRRARVLACLIGFGLIWVWLCWKWPREVLDPAFHVITSLILHSFLKLSAAAEACRLLHEESRAGTLEALSSTPLSVGEILDGHIRALERQFTLPIACVLLVDLAMMSVGAFDFLLGTSNAWLFFWLGRMVILVVDLYALGWVGLWLGLNSRRSGWALMGAAARILVLPWALLVFLLSALPGHPYPHFTEVHLFALALAISLIIDAAFIAWSRLNLRDRFRAVAAGVCDSGQPGTPARPGALAAGAAVKAEVPPRGAPALTSNPPQTRVGQ